MLLRFSVAFPAIVAVLAVHSEPENDKLAAVDKAVELMETLRDQVAKEGEEEAQTYNKFSCFCKDETTDRLAAIKRGEDEKESLAATINGLANKRDDADAKIAELEKDIKKLEEDIKKAKEERAKTLAQYEADAADLRAALDGLSGAIQSVKASKSPSLVELRSVSETVRTAVALADALGLSDPKTSKALTVFLQQPDNEVQMEDYKFHSDNIIETLEGLQKKFRATRDSVQDDEVESVKDHDLLMQDKTHEKKMKNKQLDKTRKHRSQTIDEIGMNSEELSTVDATLLQDKEYTNKLSKMCSDKAKTWDQRTRVRADELATLTEAIGMIKEKVMTQTSKNTIRFAQQHTSMRFAKVVAANTQAMDAIEAAAEEADAAPAFVQVASRQHGRLRASLKTADPREVIAQALKSSGEHLKSTLLTTLASRISADPLAKVKQLINELIERLLTEAANEANQKGWCDKGMSDAKQKREYAAEEVADLNSQMATLEATRDQLTEDLDQLSDDIKDLKQAQHEADEDRNATKAQNEATIEEADQGLSALNLCIDLLDKFYKTIKKEKVDLSLVQQSPGADAPDAGFDNGEAYTGSQSEAGGIMGMLDVMKSDFERTISMTRESEEKSEKDHLEFSTETGMTLAEKTEAESSKSDQRSDAVSKHGEAADRLDQEMSTLVTSIDELKELKEACIDTGMSYDERVARREQEIESLNKAMCIFENYQKYGPEAAGEC